MFYGYRGIFKVHPILSSLLKSVTYRGFGILKTYKCFQELRVLIITCQVRRLKWIINCNKELKDNALKSFLYTNVSLVKKPCFLNNTLTI